jgi:hypothetical protein
MRCSTAVRLLFWCVMITGVLPLSCAKRGGLQAAQPNTSGPTTANGQSVALPRTEAEDPFAPELVPGAASMPGLLLSYGSDMERKAEVELVNYVKSLDLSKREDRVKAVRKYVELAGEDYAEKHTLTLYAASGLAYRWPRKEPTK